MPRIRTRNIDGKINHRNLLTKKAKHIHELVLETKIWIQLGVKPNSPKL